MKTIVFALSMCLFFTSFSIIAQNPNQEKPTEVLLFGTFHFHNPGLDVAKTKSFDIESEESQKELEEITDKIKIYNPSKIFVEWTYNEQEKLDSLYDLYVAGTYFDNPKLSSFYKKNEIFQLAFRAAKKLGHKKVYAMDYSNTNFPFDSLMQVAKEDNQTALQEEILQVIQEFSTDFDAQIDAQKSLKEIIYYTNSSDLRQKDLSLYTQIITKVGNKDNFVGAYLASEWYRRNLYMLSVMQKQITKKDEKVMILLGSGHVALINEIISTHSNLKGVELQDVLD
ncbi:hypothetical protein Fleli_2403 [Bernardetia litoralis DSM 6794]|uniref:TraB/GumN family protein n=1 Tax=Bernardetia litoralis (strain ATCC 23117 / DSM 6794 / NBRC 15988 / NCIMB 1366 / Fx l1 / Sio-4) TaxID=880071 RepID=I4ALD5_BERLS|nr:DUF5694 domain-containing protein [Bernardetia litoralis]AFM04770.1 hypothetical protein Fleli_2403 [Bernardetia litoralis DSM 6794]